MKNFFKIVFATFTGIFLFWIFSIFLFVIILLAVVPSEKEIEDQSVLRLELDKRIVERETGDFFTKFSKPFSGMEPGTIGLLELRTAIKNAAKNENIKGIYLSLKNINAGFATLEELRQELEAFKKSGKFIIAYSEVYSEGAYYLASVADKIYLPPSGLLEFNGLNVEVLFFKKLMDKLGIEPEVFKVGQFKSAVEPFISEEMSVANRAQLNALLSSIYSHMINQISLSRDIPASELRLVSDSMLVRNPADALKYGLISDIAYYDDCEKYMESLLKIDQEDSVSFVNYMTLIDTEKDKGGKNNIAVVYATGDIIDGIGDENTIGSETLSAEIRKAREDSTIKAIVLRINSPGGSALGSDIIWREVALASHVKPVIASMSDLAASGGYYIAAACDTILAYPTTITGSIGVFGVLFNGQEFLNDKLGITTDKEQTGPFADIGSFTRPISEAEKNIIQQEVEQIYNKFLVVVAEGRNLDTSFVHEIAQGRVWSGLMAKDKMLVDETAGIDKAIAIAAERAGISDYNVIHLPETGNLLFKKLFSELSGSYKEALLKEESGELYPYLQKLRTLKKMNGVQARLPYEFITQ